MTYYLPTAIVFLFEFFVSFFTITQLAQMKRKPFTVISTGLLIYTLYYLLFMLIYHPYLNAFLSFSAVVVWSVICFEMSPKRTVIIALMLTGLLILSEFLAMMLLTVLFGSDIETYLENEFHYIVFSVISKFIYYIIVYLIVYSLKKMNLKNVSKENLPLYVFIYPICGLFAVFVNWSLSVSNTLSEKDKQLMLVSTILMFLATVLTYVFYYFASENEYELAELKLSMKKASIENDYYKLLDYQQRELKKIVHDEKNHLQTIRNITDDIQIKEYIDSIYSDIERHDVKSLTKNKFLDCVLNKYQIQCDMLGIRFITSIMTSNLSFMKNEDVTILISNLLDNAIDAALKSEKKTVELSINSVLNHTAITCVNSCDEAPVHHKKELVTSKDDKSMHGLGIKNIKKTVKKYNGDYTWKYNDDEKEFITVISLSNK